MKAINNTRFTRSQMILNGRERNSKFTFCLRQLLPHHFIRSQKESMDKPKSDRNQAYLIGEELHPCF